MNVRDETIVWLNFKNGDEQAFSFIFKTYYSLLFQYGIKLNSDSDLVKDTIQELFINLWETRARLGNAVSIKFYLLKSFRRKLVRVIQKQNKVITANQLSDNYEFEVVFSMEDSLILEEADREQMQQLMTALNSLLPRQKEAIYLRLYNNFSYEEISELMGVNVQTVRNYVHQAIGLLRKKMLVGLSVFLLKLLAEPATA